MPLIKSHSIFISNSVKTSYTAEKRYYKYTKCLAINVTKWLWTFIATQTLLCLFLWFTKSFYTKYFYFFFKYFWIFHMPTCPINYFSYSNTLSVKFTVKFPHYYLKQHCMFKGQSTTILNKNMFLCIQ